MSRPQAEADDDSYKSWHLGLKAAREKRFRAGVFEPNPNDTTQLRWAAEGRPELSSQYDTARESPVEHTRELESVRG